MSEHELLKTQVEACEVLLQAAQTKLDEYESSPEFHTYTTLEDGESSVYNRLYNQASEACEGSFCCGEDKYEQEFIVNGKHFLGTLTLEYNRHDKTYYYIDGEEFTVSEL